MDGQKSVRIDKWLWAARRYRTRSKASAACSAGHITLNGQPAKPSRAVKPQDILEIRIPGGSPHVLRVVELAQRRGPASEAQRLYEDLTPPSPTREPPPVRRERGLGRPTKRDRRLIQALFND